MTEHCKKTCDACDDTGGSSFSCPARTTNTDMEGPLFVPVLDDDQESLIERRGGSRSKDWHLAPVDEYIQPQKFVHIRGKLFNSDCSEMKRPSDFITIWYAGAKNSSTGYFLSLCFCLQSRPIHLTILMLFAVAAFASNTRGAKLFSSQPTGGQNCFHPSPLDSCM